MDINYKYEGSLTARNLLAAYRNEASASLKYFYFASQAKKDGFEQIASLLTRTAENEKEHAKIWYKELYGIGSTQENLTVAADGEHHEWTDMYKDFAETARYEGFNELADTFEQIAMIEQQHEEKFRRLLRNVENDKVFERSELKIWECRNCGHICIGISAPEECPTCKHPKAFFEIKAENY